MKISFINLVACACEAAGADIARYPRPWQAISVSGSILLEPALASVVCFPKDASSFRFASQRLEDFSLL